jgi:hypothetical protein
MDSEIEPGSTDTLLFRLRPELFITLDRRDSPGWNSCDLETDTGDVMAFD